MKENEKGITLIEIMIVIAVIGVLISAIYLSYFSANNVFRFNSERIIFHRDQRLISETMDEYIRSADTININGNELEINGSDVVFKENDDNYFVISKNGNEKILTQSFVDSNPSFEYNNKALTINLTLIRNDETYSFQETFYKRVN